MQIKIFRIPASEPEPATIEMNRFLQSRKIIDIDRYFVPDSINSFWSFCVRYLDKDPEKTQGKKPSVDYKEVLDEPTFKIFSDLRECRKMIAEKEAIPVYTIFTNEELANIARLDEMTPENLQNIRGIGKNKAEKFGIPLLEIYNSR